MNLKQTFKQGIAWGLYDFANSGYFLVYVVLTFPLYVSSQLMADDTWFEAKWGLAQGAAIVLAVLFGLIFGKKLDRIGIEKVVTKALLLAGFSSLLIPLLVALNASGNVILMGFALMHALYLLSLTIYDSSLKYISTGEESVEVSGWAWGWGYVGGLLCMAFMAVGNLFWSTYSAHSFLVGSLFFLVFSYLASRKLRAQIALGLVKQTATESKTEAAPTEHKIVKKRSRLALLLVFILIVDGIAIFMGFFSLYGTKVLGASEGDITKMLAVLQILAFPLTGLLSGIAQKSFKGLLFFCALAWATATALAIFAPSISVLWLCVILMAAAVGTTQSLLRSLYADTLPQQKAIQGFGVFAVVEKGAAFIGPITAGILIPFVGYTKVILVAGAMVAVGCLLIGQFFVKERT